MLDVLLAKRTFSQGKKITVKGAVSLVTVLLSVLLPYAVHAIYGVSGGIKFLPMYLPVIVGGLLLGKVWGTAVGILCPIVSFVITNAVSEPMPSLSRLPYIMAELAVIALVCGAFSRKVVQNGYFSFIAVITAFLAGRATFALMVFATESLQLIPFSAAKSQIIGGVYGVLLQCAVAPVVVIALRKLLIKDNKND